MHHSARENHQRHSIQFRYNLLHTLIHTKFASGQLLFKFIRPDVFIWKQFSALCIAFSLSCAVKAAGQSCASPMHSMHSVLMSPLYMFTQDLLYMHSLHRLKQKKMTCLNSCCHFSYHVLPFNRHFTTSL